MLMNEHHIGRSQERATLSRNDIDTTPNRTNADLPSAEPDGLQVNGAAGAERRRQVSESGPGLQVNGDPPRHRAAQLTRSDFEFGDFELGV